MRGDSGPVAYAREVGECDARETAMSLAGVGLAAAAGLMLLRRRRRR